MAVLCDREKSAPDLHALADQVELRFADDAGLGAALGGTDVLLAWDFSSEALRTAWTHASSLRWVHVAAAGVDRMLFDELVESDVVVTNGRGVFDQPVAEFVLGYILAVVKDTYGSHDRQRAGEWHHRDTRSLAGQTVLVVGTGSIGRAIARLLRTAGMQVRGAGRTARAADPDFGTVVSSAELAAHVGWADHLVIATPLTDQTRGLVDAEVLAAMVPSGHLVNVARGACIVEADLVAALRQGRLAAASLDVFDTEPLPRQSDLWRLPGVHVTAHMSGDVEDSVDRLAAQFVDNVQYFLAGEPLANVVDKRLGYVRSAPPAAVQLPIQPPNTQPA